MEKLPLDTTRQELLDILRNRGIHDSAVLKAFATVDRERFVPQAFARKAYNDIALPIGLNQTISQPFTVAFMTQELHIKPGLHVLEVGTGSGYQAAILSAMGAKVVSLERQLGLYEKAVVLLNQVAPDVECIYGDGSIGYVKKAPYDRIIVTAGAPKVPTQLVKQLKIGGRLICPVGDMAEQNMTIVDRISETQFKQQNPQPNFSFVPLIGEGGWEVKGSSASS